VSYRLVGAQTGLEYPTLPEAALPHGPVPHRHPHPLEKIPAAPAWTVDAVLELNGEWHGKDETANVFDPNSGGHVLLLSPGLCVSYAGFSGSRRSASHRQPDERAAVEDRIPCPDRRFLCLLTAPGRAAAVIRSFLNSSGRVPPIPAAILVQNARRTLTMTRSVFVRLVIALAVALVATAATAHEGYSHGSKAKKVKKPKAKQAAIVFRVARRAA